MVNKASEAGEAMKHRAQEAKDTVMGSSTDSARNQ